MVAVVDDILLAAFAEAAPEMFAIGSEAAAATAGDVAAADFAASSAAMPMGTEAAAAGLAGMGPEAAMSQAGAGPGAGIGMGQGAQALPATSPVIPPTQNAAANMGLKASANTASGLSPSGYGTPYGLTSPSTAPGGITSIPTTPPAEPSGLGKWWGGLSPFEKGMAAYAGATGLARLGAFGYGSTPSNMQPYSGPLAKYSLSPNFQPRIADPTQFQYAPKQYAEGGIASAPSYAKGGNLSDAMDYYKMMTAQTQDIPEGRRSPSAGIDTGIYYDTDPDTQRLDALTAAQIRQAKINKRTGIQGQGMTRPPGMGQLNLAPMGIKSRQDQQDQDMSAAQGGIMQAYAGGGPVEQMSNNNAVGANTGYPMANMQRNAYAVPYQQPISQNVISGPQDANVDEFTGAEKLAAGGGISSLGGYAAGGNPRLLKGPGDGMSDNIPAMIGNKQPARLADGEFVVPADVVSHLGNGSTDAGADKLHQMMTKVRRARTGNPKQGKQINPDKYVPK